MLKPVVWVPAARKAYHEELRWLKKHFGENKTRAFMDRVTERIRIIQENPFIGQADNSNELVRSIPIQPYFRLYYSIEQDTLVVFLFFDVRQNPSKLGPE